MNREQMIAEFRQITSELDKLSPTVQKLVTRAQTLIEAIETTGMEYVDMYRNDLVSIDIPGIDAYLHYSGDFDWSVSVP